MKSAYERALEKMEAQGIERPDDLDENVRVEIAEIRSKADAKLAELEIMRRESLQKAGGNPEQADEHYQSERRRVEEDRDRKIAQLRA